MENKPQRRILVIEDDETLVAGLLIILSRAGYQTKAALSESAALQIMQTFTPDLIVTDIHMPDMTGLELIQTVRAQPEWADIPFVIVSARTKPGDEEQIAALGRVARLGKPFEIETLLDVIDEQFEANS